MFILFSFFHGLFTGFINCFLIAFSRFFHGVAVAIFANLERALDFEAWGIFWGWALAQLSLKKYAPQ
jgi:hypothetical protein